MKKGVQKIYSEVASTYERINHILTLGMDIVWRNKIARLASKKANGEWWLDICSGTGEMTTCLNKHRKGNTKVISADFSPEMIFLSKQRNNVPGCSFVLTDAKKMPFPANQFDLITISFATRNIDSNRERLISYFKEFNRVLKPGGLFVNLETSQPDLTPLKTLFHLYVKLFVKKVGLRISGSESGYAYLAHTIPRFYGYEELASILKDSGFQTVSYKKLFLGIAAIHSSVK